MCLVCGSARDNEFWGCEYCIALKPRLDPKWKDGRTDFVEPEFFVPYKI